VRELRNLAERYVLLGDACDFDLGSQELPAVSNSTLSLPQRLENFEKMLIQNELERHAGSIKETLNTLGVPRKTLYDKMRKYALDKADYK
jgi:two-component system C4-dicarboxylate transport response regulator DctD